MSRELLKQCLDKFEHLWEIGIDAHYRVDLTPDIRALREELAKPEQDFFPDWDTLQPFHERIAELEQKLAKPEQAKYSDIVSDGGLDPRNKFDAQHEQEEPLAWATFDGEGNYDFMSYEDNEDYRYKYIKDNGQEYANWVKPLYAVPRKEWVSLTKEEKTHIYMQADFNDWHDGKLLDAIETRLKEKNI
jgi:hypothetical protein